MWTTPERLVRFRSETLFHVTNQERLSSPWVISFMVTDVNNDAVCSRRLLYIDAGFKMSFMSTII